MSLWPYDTDIESLKLNGNYHHSKFEQCRSQSPKKYVNFVLLPRMTSWPGEHSLHRLTWFFMTEGKINEWQTDKQTNKFADRILFPKKRNPSPAFNHGATRLPAERVISLRTGYLSLRHPIWRELMSKWNQEENKTSTKNIREETSSVWNLSDCSLWSVGCLPLAKTFSALLLGTPRHPSKTKW